jgi:hypothetical protein
MTPSMRFVAALIALGAGVAACVVVALFVSHTIG